ncbi:MAG: hypothetical protein WCF93_02275 [Candidatus Moraniibacteriota bacterium]
MEIDVQNRKKLGEIFKILEFSKKENLKQMDALGERLLLDVVAQALADSDDVLGEEIQSKDDVADFLLKHYSPEEIKSLTDLVFRDVVVEFFAKLIKAVEDDKKEQIEEILDSIE